MSLELDGGKHVLAMTGEITKLVSSMGFIFKDTEPSPAQDSSGVRQKGDLLGPPPVVTTCRKGLAVRTGLASLAGPFPTISCQRGVVSYMLFIRVVCKIVNLVILQKSPIQAT